MNRRTLLKAIPVGAVSLATGGLGFHRVRQRREASAWLENLGRRSSKAAADGILDPVSDEGSGAMALRAADGSGSPDPFQKIRDFDRQYPDDFLLPEDRLDLLVSASARFERAQRLVGHGNFNLLSFDRLLAFGNNYPEIGTYTPQELTFLEEAFYTDATSYGFLGEKVLTELTDETSRRDVEKVSGSGHFLFKGEPLEKFQRIRRDVGDTIRLTSGVRCLAKQYQLFLRKAVVTGGNLSQASRSLAPPGYSFHARGDFDIGTVDLGADNFTVAFAETDEYKKMIDLGYAEIRYTETNPYGVRHEPWHIKIA